MLGIIIMSGPGPISAMVQATSATPVITQVLTAIAIVGVPSAICMGIIAALTILGHRR